MAHSVVLQILKKIPRYRVYGHILEPLPYGNHPLCFKQGDYMLLPNLMLRTVCTYPLPVYMESSPLMFQLYQLQSHVRIYDIFLYVIVCVTYMLVVGHTQGIYSLILYRILLRGFGFRHPTMTKVPSHRKMGCLALRRPKHTHTQFN